MNANEIFGGRDDHQYSARRGPMADDWDETRWRKKKQIIGRSDCDDEKSIRIDEKKNTRKKNKRKKNRTQRFARQRRPEEASASSSRSHPTGTFSIRQLRERNVQNEENDASQTLIKCVLKTINTPKKKDWKTLSTLQPYLRKTSSVNFFFLFELFPRKCKQNKKWWWSSAIGTLGSRQRTGGVLMDGSTTSTTPKVVVDVVVVVVVAVASVQ